MAPVFLIGGGREDDRVRASHAPFVAACGGGPIVAYAHEEALAGWRAPDVPYAGFSSGAAVAAARAIVGGWRLAGRDVCAEEAGEDLEELAVRDGLGLVDFAVDVHATQWGTLTRLVHAVGAGLVEEGRAVDEGTVLVADGGSVRVEGLGSAYRVAARGGAVAVSVQP